MEVRHPHRAVCLNIRDVVTYSVCKFYPESGFPIKYWSECSNFSMQRSQSDRVSWRPKAFCYHFLPLSCCFAVSVRLERASYSCGLCGYNIKQQQYVNWNLCSIFVRHSFALSIPHHIRTKHKQKSRRPSLTNAGDKLCLHQILAKTALTTFGLLWSMSVS